MSMSEAHALEERGRRLRKAGNLVEAERVLKQCVSILETRRGLEGCKHMYGPLLELELCLLQTGRKAENELIVKRCLFIQEADLGPTSKHSPKVIHLAAGHSAEAGRTDEAVGMFKRALAIEEAEMGPNDAHLIPTLSVLGHCLHQQGKLIEAEAFFRRCLALLEATMGGAYNPTRTTLVDLAFRCFQHILCTTLHKLGLGVMQAGKLEEAEGMLRRSLTIQETRLAQDSQSQDDLSHHVIGRKSTLLVSTLGLLGTCLLQAKKIEEAEQFLRRCLATAESGKESFVEVSDALLYLSRCLRQKKQGKFGEEAEKLLRRCLEIREINLGADDDMVVSTQRELGMFLLEDPMRPQEAERVLRHCLEIQDAKLDPSDLQIAYTLWSLAACLSQVGKLEEARRTLRRCLAIEEAIFGGDDVNVAGALHLIGLHLRQSGEQEEAEEKFKRCLAIHEAKLEQDSFMMASTQLELGACRRSRDHERWGLDVCPSRRLSVGGSALHILDEHDWEYEALCSQFKTRWLKPPSGASIARVFSIQMPPAVRNKHDRYKLLVPVNPSQLFHGTSSDNACNFIRNPQEEAPCGLDSCSVCSICMLGFQLRDNVARTAVACNIPLRFGRGIYFSSVSGKANDYAERSTKVTFMKAKAGGFNRTATDGQKLRCMFVAHVTRGKVYTTKKARLPQAECPPLGYHSVVGEVGPALNYDETVVYKEEAALPTHLIVYSPP